MFSCHQLPQFTASPIHDTPAAAVVNINTSQSLTIEPCSMYFTEGLLPNYTARFAVKVWL